MVNKLTTLDPPLRASTPNDPVPLQTTIRGPTSKESTLKELTSTLHSTRRRYETPTATPLIGASNISTNNNTSSSTTVTAITNSTSTTRHRMPASFHAPVSTATYGVASNRTQPKLKSTNSTVATATATAKTTTTATFTSAAKRPLKWPLATSATTTTTASTSGGGGGGGAALPMRKEDNVGDEESKVRPNTYKSEKRGQFDYPIIQSASASPAKTVNLRTHDARDDLTSHVDPGQVGGLLLLKRRLGSHGGDGGPFFVDIHVNDAETVMEDADTKVEMPVELLPTPRVKDEVVVLGERKTGGEEFFDQQLKMLNSKELEIKDLTVGSGKRKGPDAGGGGGGGEGSVGEMGAGSGGATIRDLEKKGDGKTKSFKFTVDLDFGERKSRSLSLREKELSSSAKLAKNG